MAGQPASQLGVVWLCCWWHSDNLKQLFLRHIRIWLYYYMLRWISNALEQLFYQMITNTRVNVHIMESLCVDGHYLRQKKQQIFNYNHCLNSISNLVAKTPHIAHLLKAKQPPPLPLYYTHCTCLPGLPMEWLTIILDCGSMHHTCFGCSSGKSKERFLQG